MAPMAVELAPPPNVVEEAAAPPNDVCGAPDPIPGDCPPMPPEEPGLFANGFVELFPPNSGFELVGAFFTGSATFGGSTGFVSSLLGAGLVNGSATLVSGCVFFSGIEVGW